MSAKAEQLWQPTEMIKAATRWLAAFRFSGYGIDRSAKAASRSIA